MVGMSQIKKKWYQGIAIGAGIGILGMGIMGFFTYRTIKSYQEGTNKRYNAKYTSMVATLKENVIQGQTITEDLIQFTRVHKSTVPQNGLTDNVGGAINKVAKYSIAANVPLTSDMLTDEIIASDVRSQELNSIIMPSDLSQGECVDIRIMYPNGTDYIVLAQKMIDKIENTTMWMQLSESERLLINSAIVDSYLNTGTKLYATKYVDQDAQIKISDNEADVAEGYVKKEIEKKMDQIKKSDSDALTATIFDLVKKYKNYATTVSKNSENYQPNLQVMNLMKANGSILADAKAKLSEEARQNIENGIESYISDNEENYDNVVSGAEESIQMQKEQRDQLVNGEI